MSSLKPLADRVLVKPDEGERIPMDVKVGDVVIYGKFGGNEVKVDGEKYLLMRADDIYAVVEA